MSTSGVQKEQRKSKRWGLLSRSKIEKAVKGAYHDPQIFGRSLGGISVQCTFDADISKWAKLTKDTGPPQNESVTHIMGMLYFSVNFSCSGKVPPCSVTLYIDAGQPANGEPIPIFTALSPTLIEGPSTERSVRETKTTDPKLRVDVLGSGGEASGRAHEVETNMSESHNWTFRAMKVANGRDTTCTKASLEWSHTLEQHHDGTKRTYVGALLVRRDKNEPLVLVVKPTAHSREVEYRIDPKQWKGITSEPIGPKGEPSEDVESFEAFGDRAKLEEDVLRRNNEPKST